MPAIHVPYENATSGLKARDEITKLLQSMGCESVGFMDEFKSCSVLLAFTHRGRSVQLKASAAGWAVMYLKAHPWSHRKRGSKQDYEAKALKQGQIAINSILRDWVKGQVVAVECGMMSFDHVFMPHMLTPSGQPLIELIKSRDLLPPPQDE